MCEGPIRYGRSPMKARVERTMCAIDSRFSMTVRSSQAWTRVEVAWVTKSSSGAGGRLRLSSVKLESMPPPIRVPGNALRVAPIRSSQDRTPSGGGVPGFVRRACGARNDDLEDHLGADPLGELAVARQRLLEARGAQVDPAVQVPRPRLLDDIRDRQRELGVLGQDAEPEPRHRPRRAAERDRDRPALDRGLARQLALEAQRH